MDLTFETLEKAYKSIEDLKGKILVGVVCRPEYYYQLKGIAAEYEVPDSIFGGVNIYIDSDQKESYKAFYDSKELFTYLNRNKK